MQIAGLWNYDSSVQHQIQVHDKLYFCSVTGHVIVFQGEFH